MSAYDDATPEQQAAADAMIDDMSRAAMDLAKVSAMEVGMALDGELPLLMVEIGIRVGIAAALEGLSKRDLLKPPTL